MNKSKNTEVMVLGTLHGMHLNNDFFSYEHLFSILENFNPDVIGLEIREEDLLESKEYLEMYYPFEMVETISRYKSNYKIYGFDWLGEEIESELIPERYFEELEYKKLEREFTNIKKYTIEKQMIDIAMEIRVSLLLNSTAEECNDGRYGIATEIIRKQLEYICKDTYFKNMTSFNEKREKEIGNNIINIVENNKGKRLLFLTGLDHKIFILKTLKKHFENIKIIDL